MKQPDRLWYATPSGKKWHIMASQRPDGGFGWAYCGMLVRFELSSERARLDKRQLCVTCERLGK